MFWLCPSDTLNISFLLCLSHSLYPSSFQTLSVYYHSTHSWLALDSPWLEWRLLWIHKLSYKGRVQQVSFSPSPTHPPCLPFARSRSHFLTKWWTARPYWCMYIEETEQAQKRAPYSILTMNQHSLDSHYQRKRKASAQKSCLKGTSPQNLDLISIEIWIPALWSVSIIVKTAHPNVLFCFGCAVLKEMWGFQLKENIGYKMSWLRMSTLLP